MYYFLTREVRNRMVLELRKFFARHPKYRDRLPENIQGEFRFKETPQVGIVVRTAGGEPVQLSPDNFKGTERSYVTLARIPEKPGLSVEWIQEDRLQIRANNGVMPATAGVYYVEVTEHDPDTGYGEIMIDPILDIRNEEAIMSSATEGMIANLPIGRSLRLYEAPSNRRLDEDTDFTLSGQTFTLNQGIDLNAMKIYADYKYAVPSLGPFQFREERAINSAIPGVVLAFGRRVEKDDAFAVLVYRRREPSALVYGGRWSIPVEFEIVARDPDERDELNDIISVYMMGIARSWLSSEGIEIESVSMGGGGEQDYDPDGGGDYWYTANVSVQLTTEWEIYSPLDRFLRTFENLTTPAGDNLVLSDDPSAQLDLDWLSDPFFRRGVATYPVLR